VNSEKLFYEGVKIGSNRVILVNYQSGATGINLQSYSHIIVYYSPCLSSELRIQSEGRIHRIGTTQSCLYYKLVTKGSIEEKIWSRLNMLQSYTDDLFNADYADSTL
jgi:SNF2 family DNA or RNA helicase